MNVKSYPTILFLVQNIGKNGNGIIIFFLNIPVSKVVQSKLNFSKVAYSLFLSYGASLACRWAIFIDFILNILFIHYFYTSTNNGTKFFGLNFVFELYKTPGIM